MLLVLYFYCRLSSACTPPRMRMTRPARLPRVAITRTAAVVVTRGVPAAILTPEECKLFLPTARVRYTRTEYSVKHPSQHPPPPQYQMMQTRESIELFIDDRDFIGGFLNVFRVISGFFLCASEEGSRRTFRTSKLFQRSRTKWLPIHFNIN
jgi:hypothetical protein